MTCFRYLVNGQGEGVTIKDAGRIVYEDSNESTWRGIAGRHDFADGTRAWDTRASCLAK